MPKLKLRKATLKPCRHRPAAESRGQPCSKKVDAQTILTAVSDINELSGTWRRRLSPWPRPSVDDVIRCASDCSGYGSDLIAFDLLGLRHRVRCVMSSENCRHKEVLHQAVAAVCGYDMTENVHFDDIKRNHRHCPNADVYVAGYPCPSFSNAGRKAGVQDPRGFVTLEGLKYISETRPRLVILEQVSSIMQARFKRLFDFIKKTLTRLDYTFDLRVFNTRHYGVPQSRPRMYLVAIVKESLLRKLSLPDPRQAHTDMHYFLNKSLVGTEVLELPFYEEKLGGNLWRKGYILDVGSSTKFQSPMRNCCPCLTKERLKSSGYYIPKLRRRLTTAEAAAFQAVPPQVCAAMEKAAQKSKLPKNFVAAALGDAMSINVLMLLLRCGLDASGMTNIGAKRDYWLQVPAGEANAKLSQRLFEKYHN